MLVMLAMLAIDGERSLLIIPRTEGRRPDLLERESSLLLDPEVDRCWRPEADGCLACASCTDCLLGEMDRRIQDGDNLSIAEMGSVDMTSSDIERAEKV